MSLDSNNTAIIYLPRMTLSEVAAYLGKNDNRAALNWCTRHKVSYWKDGRDYVVIKQEFLFKANCEAEKVLKEKYGENWEENMKADVQPETEIQEPITHLKKNKYKPQVAEAKSFAEKWNHL